MPSKEEIAAEQKLNDLLTERAQLEEKAARLYAKKQGRSKEMNKTKTELLKLEEKIVKAEEAAYAATKPVMDVALKINKAISIRNKGIQKEINLSKKGSKLAKKTLETENQALGSLDQAIIKKQISVEQADQELDFLDAIKAGEVDIVAMKDKSAEYSALAAKAADEGNAFLADYYNDMNKVVKLKLKEAEATKRNKKLLENANAATGGMASKAVDFVKAFAKNPVAGILTAVVGLAKALFSAITAVAKKVDEIGKTFGALGKDTAFLKTMLEAETAAIRIGSNLTEVISSTMSLNAEFGIGLSKATEMASRSIEVGRALGLGADEATRLFGSLEAMGLDAEPFIETATNLALAADVAPSAVMKDIAASTDDFAMFSKDGGKNIAAAAVQAKRLGLNLSTSAKVAQGLLQFQDSITKELEASVLTGRRLNFQKARELALNNDIEGAMKAVIAQLGGEEEFNKLNAIQRQAVADSIGVSVGELAKLAQGSKKLSMESAMASGNFQDMLDKGALSGFSKFVARMKAIGAQIFNAFAPWLERASDILAEVFGDSPEMLQPMLDKVNEMGETFVTWLEEWQAGLGEEGTGGMLTRIVALFESLPETLATILGAVEAITRGMLAYKMVAMSVAAIQFALAVAKAGESGSVIPFGGPLAVAAMVMSIIGAVGALTALSFAELPVGSGANVKTGEALFHPGETVVNDVDLAQLARSGGGGGVDTRQAIRENQRTNMLLNKILKNNEEAYGTGGKMFRGLRVKES